MIIDIPAQEQIARDLQEEEARLEFYDSWALQWAGSHDIDWLDVQLECFLEDIGMLPLGGLDAYT